MLIVDAVQNAKAGHPGMALGMAEVGCMLCGIIQEIPSGLTGIEDLRCLCKLGSRTPGHPENTVTDGIEVTTGPLGQGVANAVGLALAEAHLAARFNKPDCVIIDHRIYCIMGDGCAMEGISHEAASLAGLWNLHKLTLIYDDNCNTIDGPTTLAFSEDISARFRALDWKTFTVDNIHDDMDSFKDALLSAFNETRKPTFIRVCALEDHIFQKGGTSKAHHGTFDEDDVKEMKQKLVWDHREPFHVIPVVYSLSSRLPRLLCASLPSGRNISYGVREHAMAGISNGIALRRSGLITFAATFLTFSDYMKNSVRLSALSHAGVLYSMTHDSIGLGEDGPTHQPVEQLAGLRAVPRLPVFRPADGNETAGAYKVAITSRKVPSVIALSRQKVAANLEGTSAKEVERGGYIVSDNSGKCKPEIILLGTGTELCLCEGSAKMLRKEGRKGRVVSLVCWSLFDRQPLEYKERVSPRSVPKGVGVEAGFPIGWKEYAGDGGVVIGVEDFGASGAYLDTFMKLGFTEENVTKVAKSLLTQ
ncbi:hypothetical protein GH714_033678 [Hevea brasiliensis]|uniref:Transketolase-like pyrimidine-binding domain-containing protein n=1 Tax=Hevea brasiliensis TaxID=3981 RepID=A0A6A6L7W1_HEVBR|nr:hypothetical protein GH714_033678 [Hevea brasiliensis]